MKYQSFIYPQKKSNDIQPWHNHDKTMTYPLENPWHNHDKRRAKH
jgi:hypothetical protein